MNLNQCRWLNDVFDSINFENLPHGIIINGSTGIGKKILAREIANNILLNFKKDNNFKHQVLFDKNTHPDFYLLDKDKIGVNDISRRDKWDEEKGFRDVVTFLTMTPSISKNKVVLIMNADLMNNAAQNALLKSLEEPAPYSYIIMTTNRPKALNQTIYSRCRQININNLSVIETNHWLEKVGVTDYNAMDFPSFATPFDILDDIQNDNHNSYKEFILLMNDFMFSKIDQPQAIKLFTDIDINFIGKINFLVEFLKIILASKLTNNQLSGAYKNFNIAKFSNLKISNIIDDLNNLRFDFFNVSSINETHVLNYFFSELKVSIRQS
ncbi:MAG: DNA polymerase III subunit delta' [SAR86 cluster bacterium]|uniref:DNA-directed DNA polymerase n=1 Tax=SAR86 cluster bacterium TaxID=2030880 RepID=A0A520MEZ2_9GAMM|nr:MAG: DNA polymerase III subunit delta' [SAR86 cluster bacterium]